MCISQEGGVEVANMGGRVHVENGRGNQVDMTGCGGGSSNSSSGSSGSSSSSSSSSSRDLLTLVTQQLQPGLGKMRCKKFFLLPLSLLVEFGKKQSP